VVALLTGEALKVVHVVSGSHHHLEGWYHFSARRTVSSASKQSAIKSAASQHSGLAVLCGGKYWHL
jgi:hypothetical protein